MLEKGYYRRVVKERLRLFFDNVLFISLAVNVGALKWIDIVPRSEKSLLFSVNEPAPDLQQYLYSSFRKSVYYMNATGIPIVILYMLYSAFVYEGHWTEALYLLPALICCLVIALLLLIKEYCSYLSWLIIFLGFINFFSISLHAEKVVDDGNVQAHMIAIVTVYVVAIMAIVSMLSLWQFLCSVFLGAFVPDIVMYLSENDLMDSAVRVRILISPHFS